MQSPFEAAVAMARRLHGKERVRFLQALARNKSYRGAMEDIIDGLLIEARRGEPSRPMKEFLAEHRSRSR